LRLVIAFFATGSHGGPIMPNIREDMPMLKLALAAATTCRDREVEVLATLVNDYAGAYETLIPYNVKQKNSKPSIGVWWFGDTELLVYIEYGDGRHVLCFNEQLSLEVQAVFETLLAQHLQQKKSPKPPRIWALAKPRRAELKLVISRRA
jgi:hypothetical protein